MVSERLKRSANCRERRTAMLLFFLLCRPRVCGISLRAPVLANGLSGYTFIVSNSGFVV